MMNNHRPRRTIHSVFFFHLVVIVVFFFFDVVSSSSRSSSSLSKAVLEYETSQLSNPNIRNKEKERQVLFKHNLLDAAAIVASSNNKNNVKNSNPADAAADARILRLLSSSKYGEYSLYNYYETSSNSQQQYDDQQQQYDDGYYYQQQQQQYDDTSYWDHNMVQKDFGFYITSYSFKYTGCHNIIDKDNSYPPTMSRYVTFRLCPTTSCYEWKINGCSSGSNYGEYAVPLHLYLSSLLDYNQGRVFSFCEYCQSCAMIESYKSFFHDLSLRKQYIVQYAKTAFLSWLSSSSSSYTNSSSTSNNNDDDTTVDNSQYASESQQLWIEMKNGSYTSSYVYDSQYYHSPVLNSRDSWNIQGTEKSYSSSQDSWRYMVHGSRFGTWFGRLIYPGYYNDDTDFVLCWGYYTKTGVYVCLEDTSTLYWDTNLYGSLPDSWTQFLNSTGYPTSPNDIVSCDPVGSCYDQYDTCLAILKEESENDDDQQGVQLSIKDVISCTPIYFKHLSSEQQAKITKQQKKYQYQQNNQQYQYQQQMPLFYVGPICMANNHDTSLAVYLDESCTMLNQKASSVTDLLGYNPLKTSMDLFPSECLSCRPNDDAYVWYETTEVHGEVMPVCSMLYQLAEKCNDKLKPAVTYNINSNNNHAQENVGDGCSFIKSLNADHPSWLAQLTRTSAKAPQAFILVSLVMVFGMTVAFLFMLHNGVEPARIFDDMSTIGTATSTAFDYESVVSTFHRFDSGISKIRQQSRVQRKKPSRARTAPSGIGRIRTIRQKLGAWEEEEEEDEDMEQ